MSQPTTVLTTAPARTISQLQTLSPSQDNTNPEVQPTTNTDSPGSQPTTAHLRTTPTRTISQLQTLSHLGHNPQQSFSGLHQPGRSANYKYWLACVTINNSPSQEYTNPDVQPVTNTDSPGSQPTTVLPRTSPTRTISQLQALTHMGQNEQHWILLRTTATRTINQPQTLTHLGHKQQQSSLELHQPGRSTNYKSLQTLTHPGHNQQQLFSELHETRTIYQLQKLTNIDSPCSQPTTALFRTTQTRTIHKLQKFTNIDSP